MAKLVVAADKAEEVPVAAVKLVAAVAVKVEEAPVAKLVAADKVADKVAADKAAEVDQEAVDLNNPHLAVTTSTQKCRSILRIGMV